MVFTDYRLNYFGYSGSKKRGHHDSISFQRLWSPNIWRTSWFKITSPVKRCLAAKAPNQVMPWVGFDLKIKGDGTMGGWLIFFFGGVIGFCLGVVYLILMISVGESEMCLEQINVKEQ